VTFEIVLSRKGIFDEYLENTKRKTMYTVCDMFDVIPNEFVIIADGQVYWYIIAPDRRKKSLCPSAHLLSICMSNEFNE